VNSRPAIAEIFSFLTITPVIRVAPNAASKSCEGLAIPAAGLTCQ
jgi:hypothetical protein